MARKPKAVAEAPGIGHNSDAHQAALLTHLTKFRAHRAKIQEIMDVLKAAKKAYKVARSEAKLYGFTLEILDEALDVESVNDRDAAKAAAERRFVFETLGLPLGISNGELFGDQPSDMRDEAYWGQHGFNAGLRDLERKPPSECPQAWQQTWLRQHVAGVEKAMWALAETQNTERRPGSVGTGPTASEIARNGSEQGDELNESDESTGDERIADPLLN